MFLTCFMVKNPSANAGDKETWLQSLDQENLSGGGNGNKIQYSCLENPMSRGAWWATVNEITKRQAWLSTRIHTHIEWYVPHLYLVSWNVKWNDVNSDLMEVLWGLKEESCVEACQVLGCVGQTLTDNGSFLAWSLEVQSLKNSISKTALPVGRVNYHRQCSERQKSQSWVISRRS